MHPLTGLCVMALPLLAGGCMAPVGVTIASYAADGALWLATDKTSTDHLISIGSGKDCALFRVVKGREICVERQPGEENPYNVDPDAPHREVGEGGMVTAYSASRHGGRLLTDEEARVALAARPVPTGSPPRDETPAAVPADLQSVEIADAAPPAVTVSPASARTSKPTPGRKPVTSAGRAAGKKSTVAGRKAAPVAARRTAPRRPAQAMAAKPKPAPVRAARQPTAPPVTVATATPDAPR